VVAAEAEDGLDVVLAVDSDEVDVVFGDAEAEVCFVGGLEVDVV